MFFKRISFKIGLWYFVTFAISTLLLFAITAFFLMRSLQDSDRKLLTEKLQEYEILYSRDGIKGLQNRTANPKTKNTRDYLVRLSDPTGNTLFLYSPDRSDDEDAPTAETIEEFLRSHSQSQSWIVIPGYGFGDDVEVVSQLLTTGELLQVGKDIEDREAFFESFAYAYFEALIPILIFAIAVGIFLSNRLLNPLRELTQTIRNILAGKSNSRVPHFNTQDELGLLGELFNEVLEKNEKLITGMRDTVDNVAHDLRTPITRIRNSVEKALIGKQDKELFHNALIDCHDNTELIVTLINNIMDISEAEAGTLHLKQDTFSSMTLIENAVDLYGFVAEERDIKIQIIPTASFQITGDKTKLLQAISNLVDNAIKYSPANSTITIESNIENQLGLIKIIDQGIGIAAEDLDKIWNRLYRADSSRSSRGLGLGLSLVKAISQAHNIQVGVHSAPSHGSTFYLQFPLVK